MNALLLSMLFVPAAPVPKGGDPDLAAAQKLLVDYSERPRARVGAVMLMGRLRSPAAIPEVRACLKDPDRRLREMAVAALVDLDAIDDACLKALDELEEELAAITDGSDTRFFFQHIFYAAERHPTHAAKLVPFIHRQYAAQSPDVRMGELVRLRERFACAVPGLLDKIAQHLKAIDPAKATQEDHFEVLSFAKAMRREVDPSKAAVEELDRWWSTDKFGIDLEIAETLLRLDPKNKRAPQILEYNIDRFEAATSDHAVRMAKFLPLVRSHPALFSKMGKLAFTPGIGDNARPMFWAIGRRGEASLIFAEDLERWTHTKSIAAKYTAMEALVRIKPEAGEKYIPLLFAGLDGENPYEASLALWGLHSLGVKTPELKARLEKALREWVPMSSGTQAAEILLRLDPNNKVAGEWVDARLKEWPETQRPDAIAGGDRYHVPAMLAGIGPSARKFAPSLVKLLTTDAGPNPHIVLVDAIGAISNPLPR